MKWKWAFIPITPESFVEIVDVVGGSGKRQLADGLTHAPSGKPKALPTPPGDTKYSILIGIVLGLSVALTGGCSRPLHGSAGDGRVIVEGGGQFPSPLAGRWQASQHGWEFEFEPDGRIASAILSLGRVRVVPGRTTTMPTKSGHQAVFTPGLWTVHYIPSTRELTVEIIMTHVRVEMGGNILEGSSTDTFVGPVAASNRTWLAQWTTFTRYLAHTPDGASINLSTDPTYGETRSLTFEKANDGSGP